MGLAAAWAWIKSKAGWLIAAAGALLFTVIAVALRGVSRSEVKSALALRRLQDTADSHDAAQKHADALKAKTDALAEALVDVWQRLDLPFRERALAAE